MYSDLTMPYVTGKKILSKGTTKNRMLLRELFLYSEIFTA